MRRRLTACTAAVLALGLSGCGLSGGAGEQEPPDLGGEITGTITFQTWSLKANHGDYVESVIAGFEAAHPGAHVEWLDQPGDGYAEKVLSQAAAGELPDVVNLPPDFALPLAAEGMLLDIGAADPKLRDDYVAGGVSAYEFPGRDGAYGYPWYLNTDVNYWNADLMERYGLDADSRPTTLDELIAQARVMKEKSGGEMYLMSRKPALGDLADAGVPIMAPDGKSFTFNTPEAAALLDKYRDAFADGLLPDDVLTDKYAGNAELFTSRKAAWTTGGGNYISEVAKSNPTLADAIVPSPAMGTPPLYVQGLSVAAGAENPAAALALARWVTNAENQAAFAKKVPGIFPSTTASAQDPYFARSDGTNAGDAKVIAFESLANAELLQPVTVDQAMTDVINQQISLAVSGDVSSREALDAAVEQCDRLLAD